MKLKVKGDIVPNDIKGIYDWFGWESCSPSDAEKAVEAAADGEELEVEISSGGGEITAGSEIYSAIRGYRKGAVNIRVTGLAASAASVIAMAGRCEMAPTALMMIHCVSTGAYGNHSDMEQAAEMLREADQALMTAYIEKTGMDRKTLGELMDRETWISASRAVELGFADGIIPAGTPVVEPMTASLGMRLSAEKLEKLKMLIEREPNPDMNRAKAELEYLTMKGV